jgi:PAS domain S-box-containing protein
MLNDKAITPGADSPTMEQHVLETFPAQSPGGSDAHAGSAVALDASGTGEWELDIRARLAHRWARYPGRAVYSAPVDPQDHGRVTQGLEGVLQTGGPHELEFRVRAPNGHVRWMWVQTFSEVDEAGRPCRVAFMQVDITHRRLAEQSLRDSELQLRLALRGGDLGLWDWDAATGHMAVNERWLEMLGLDPQGSAPTIDEWHALVHPDDMHQLDRLVQEVILNPQGTDFEAEVRAQHREGHWVWLLDRGAVVGRAADGTPLRVVGTHMDITHRKTAEALLSRHREWLEREVAERTRELATARDAAEQANRAKSVFLSRMSHELRTPLNAVLGFSQLLELDPMIQASARAMAKIGHIRTAGEHLLSMIDEVLDLARIEAGSLSVSLELVEIAPLMHECMVLTETLARKHQVSVHFHEGKPGLCAMTDRRLLRQVIVNLLTNALKYNRPQGEVHLSIQAQPRRVNVMVRDTGVGLSSDQLTRLFEPFARLGAETRGIEGTGLGLVISKQLLTAIGGTLDIQSVVGQGSIFTMCLPQQHRQAASPSGKVVASGSASAAPVIGSLRVLYVEDNPVNMELMRQILGGRQDVVLDTAACGQEGLAQAHRLHPDLLLVDINLPDMDGLEFLHQLRQDVAFAATPCIAVSACATEVDIRHARDAGFSDYITKPFRIQKLLDVMALHRPHSVDASH